MTLYREIRVFWAAALVVGLAGCGGGGGSNNDSSDEQIPKLSVADAVVDEGDSGTKKLTFTISLDQQANGSVDVDYATSDESATAGEDYVASSGTATITGGTTQTTVGIIVNGDSDFEPEETITLSLATPSANAEIGMPAIATGTITNDDIRALNLNDTGIDWCGDRRSNNLNCPVSDYPHQDAKYGRDATHDDDSDGHAGFVFTKLDADGDALPASATDWTCVRDQTTGLIWEVKTKGGDLRDEGHTYTWYNPDSSVNGGTDGRSNGGTCAGGIDCDTQAYVQAVNNQGLCGFSDWRMPNRRELHSIVDHSRTNVAIDTGYFPNTPETTFWSASGYAILSDQSYQAWSVNFGSGADFLDFKSNHSRVRLVRYGK